jgi:hypothetical protein
MPDLLAILFSGNQTMPLPQKVLPMTIDEYRYMSRPLGWKHEYFDGAAAGDRIQGI